VRNHREGWCIDVSKVLIAVLFASCVFVSCYNPDDYALNEGLSPDEVIVLNVSPTEIPADGTSFTTLVATIEKKADADKRSVKFTTTIGQFLGTTDREITAQADAEGVATADLVSVVQEARATVQASIAGVVRQKTVDFVRAYPETIVVDPGTFALTASVSEQTTVTAELRRQKGVVTSGTSVDFSAVDTTGSRIGQFRDTKLSGDGGRATAIFSVGNTAYRGSIVVRARVDVLGIVIEGSSSVTVTD
jgi:hypothetical protein